MKRLFSFSALALLMVAMSSCFHDWITPPSEVAKGEWQWMYSVGGIGNDTILPSDKAIISLNLNNDSTYALYEGAGLVDSSRYSMHMGNNNQSVLHFPHALTVDKLHLQQEQWIVKKDSTNLHLSDYNITDGFIHYFKKVN